MYPVLTYHTIGDYEAVLPAGINTPTEVFRSHMHYLFQHEYRVFPLDQIVEYIINGQKPNRKTLAITFDDGYEDHFTNVYPILKQYGFQGTIFLTIQFIDRYWESGKAPGGMIKGLSRDQILEMQDEGIFRFGSHGFSHKNLLEISEANRLSEIRDSKLYLEALLGQDVPFISYPFGAYDEGIKNAVKAAGYKAGFSIWNRESDIYSIRRVPLHTNDGLMRFKFKISSLYPVMRGLLRSS